MRGRAIAWSVILLAAIVIRFHGLAQQEIFSYDEASYLLEGRKLAADVAWVPDALGARMRHEPAPAEWRGPVFGGVARPLHYMLLALFATETPPLLAMALLGVACVGFVAVLAAEICPGDARDSCAPELAALLLATSPAHAYFSRAVIAEIDAAFLLLLGIYYHRRALDARRLWICGAIFGCAFALQSRLTLLLPFLLAAEAFAHRSLERLVRLSCGFLLPLIAIEGFYEVLTAMHVGLGGSASISTYVNQYAHQIVDGGGAIRFNRPWFGFRYLAFEEGILPLALFLAGGVIVLARRSRWRGAHRALFWYGLGLWTIAAATFFDQDLFPGSRYGRSLSPAFPALSIGAALPLDMLWRRGGIRRGLAVAAIAAILFARADLLGEVIHLRADSGRIFREAIARTGTAHVFSEQPIHIYYYLGMDSYPSPFSPRSDSLTVVIFDEDVARCYPFHSLLSAPPDFTIEGIYRTSRLVTLEEGTNPLATWPLPKPTAPVKVWVLGPEEKPKLRSLF